MEKMDIYNRVRAVPDEAKKRISGGRLKGMTDINPMWRIKTMTELFGPCGIGWWTENERYTSENGTNGERAICCELDLYYMHDGEQSKPLHGVGGALIVAKERNGDRLDDEAWKKARTDAISVACKSLGIGADVYWQADSTKYTVPQTAQQPQEITCDRCKGPITATTSKDGKQITPAQLAAFSRKRYNGGTYCAECQKALEKARKEREEAMKGTV